MSRLDRPPAPASTTIPEWLASAAMTYGEAPALRGIEGRALTYTDLDALVRNMASSLMQAGLERNDVVLVAVPDGPVALACFLAAASVATAFPIAAQGSGHDYLGWMEAGQAKAVIMEDRPASPLTRLASERRVTLVKVRSTLANPPANLVTSIEHPRPPASDGSVRPTDLAALTLTSGTEATPKLVASSHESLHASFTAFAEGVSLTAADRSLCVMPFAHLHSLVRTTLPVLARGGEVVWAPGFDIRRCLDWFDDVRPTFMTAVPSIYRKIVARIAEMKWRPKDGMPLRLAGVGSDKVDGAVLEDVRNILGTRPFQFYGLTETCPHIAMTPTTNGTGPARAAGRVNAVWEVKCVDEAGQAVPRGVDGEIVVRGGLINPIVDATNTYRQDVRDGWFHTGDVGRIDDEDFLFVTGRLGDRITRGGKKIEPDPVEAVLSRHPAVGEVAVFGLPDEVLGQLIAAVVVPAEGAFIDLDDLKRFAGEKLPADAMPDKFFVAAEIETTPRGKMSRSALAAKFASAGDHASSRVSRPRGNSDVLEQGVLAILRRASGFDALEAEADFYQAGGDSFGAITALADLEGVYGASITPQAFRSRPNAVALADEIRDRNRSTDHLGELVPVQEEGDLTPLFLAPGVDGQNGYAMPLAAALGRDQPLYTFFSRGPNPSSSPQTLGYMAVAYVDMLRAVQPDGPYMLAGYSFGAHLAYEMAQSLLSKGQTVQFLGIIDDEADLERRNFGIVNRPAPGDYVYTRNYWAAQSDAKQPIGVPITYFAAPDNVFRRSDAAAGWGYLSDRNVDVIDLPGNHFSIMGVGAIDAWAGRLGEKLAEARRVGDGAKRRRIGHAQRIARKHVLAAIGHCKRGALKEEIRSYRNALAATPDQPFWVHGNFAEACFQNGEIEPGIAAYQTALQVDPWPLSTMARFAPLLGQLGLRDLVRDALNHANLIPIDTAAVSRQVAGLCQLTGRIHDAEKALRKGLGIDPASSATLIQLSDLLIERKSYRDALKLLRTAMSVYAGDWVTLRILGRVLFEIGEFEEAEQRLRDSIRLCPGHREAYDILARLLKATDREKEALRLEDSRPPP